MASGTPVPVDPAVVPSLLFFIVNVAVLLLILRSNRRQKPDITDERTAEVLTVPPKAKLSAAEVLGWEFEYARASTSEAMSERHTLVNIYLLVTGVLLSGVAAVLGAETKLPPAAGTVLLWLLCAIGWLDFLAIVRLRQAWVESTKVMTQIKDFYVQHAGDFPDGTLDTAFRWKTGTLPKADKPWTVFFYSAMLIALIDSVAYAAGGILLGVGDQFDVSLQSAGSLTVLGLAFLLFHARLYFAFLKPKRHAKSSPASGQAEEYTMQNTTSPNPQPTRDYRVEIESEKTAYKFHSLFRIVEAQLRYRRNDGQMSRLLTRVNFERGAAVAVLLYDPQQDAVVLVRQFRYPVYAALSPEARAGAGARQAWILETVAGIVEGAESATKVAQRELLEEAGCAPTGDLAYIATIYSSPGGSSERVRLYLGRVDASRQMQPTGGLQHEGEDTEVVVLPFQEALDMVARGEIQDAKTILCLQYLALHKDAPFQGPRL